MPAVGTSKGVRRRIAIGLENPYSVAAQAVLTLPFSETDFNDVYTPIEDTYNRGSSFAAEDEKGPLVATGSGTIPWTYVMEHPVLRHFFGAYDPVALRYLFLDTLEGKGATFITDQDFYNKDPFAIPPDTLIAGDIAPLWAWTGGKCNTLTITSTNTDGVRLAQEWNFRDVLKQYTTQTRAQINALMDTARVLLHRHLTIKMGPNNVPFPSTFFCVAGLSLTFTRPYAAEDFTNCTEPGTGNQVAEEPLEDELLTGAGEFTLDRLKGEHVQMKQWVDGFTTLHATFTWQRPGGTALKRLTIPQLQLTTMPMATSGVSLPGSTVGMKIQAGAFSQVASTISGDGAGAPPVTLSITTSWNRVLYPGAIITLAGLVAPDTAWNRSFTVLTNNAANNSVTLGPLEGESALPTLTDFTAGAAVTLRARLPVLILDEVA